MAFKTHPPPSSSSKCHLFITYQGNEPEQCCFDARHGMHASMRVLALLVALLVPALQTGVMKRFRFSSNPSGWTSGVEAARDFLYQTFPTCAWVLVCVERMAWY